MSCKKVVDIVIVGSGIAGCTLAWQWILNGKSVILISDVEKGSSAVAAGVYNPTILKRFTSVWKSAQQLEVLNSFYPLVEQITGIPLLHPINILRRFHDNKETKTWVKKSYKEDLKDFMSSDIVHRDIYGIDAPFNFGLVTQTGWLDTIGFMNASLDYLKSQSSLILESFDFDELSHHKDHICYKEWKAGKIIFAEGFKLRSNPYFKDLPLQGNKGEVLTIKVPGLKLDHIIKSSVFLMPYSNDLFWVGATYSREDLTDNSTETAKEFLTSRLERFLTLAYEVIDHKHGIRPTTIDRRPFIGAHRDYKNYYVFNGMGSRAVLIAPWAAQNLYDTMYNDAVINEEMNVDRCFN
ncbi:FAD-dependent oxidoreductase [uncultured Nonlabens sp.]|uniref:NAD(P)/FAD-dependent oxidoreductase n=1 Tax=uncultured Nonlabens sp. TaxID=859306 RepID=UPI002605C8B6|nr:FAD-dependent oxidoreductase [uncultured Nonlabens sp.]